MLSLTMEICTMEMLEDVNHTTRLPVFVQELQVY